MSVSGWITRARVKEILDLDDNNVARLVRRGRLNPVKSGRNNVFRENEVRRLADEGRSRYDGIRLRDHLGRFTSWDQ